MRVLVCPWHQRSPEVAAAWLELRRRNPTLASPFFHPRFTEIVARHCDNVELAQVCEAGVGIDALLVFRRTRNNVAVAVGDFLADYHGMICAPEFCYDPYELLRQCGLIAFEFKQVLMSGLGFAPTGARIEPSRQINLSSGFDSYRRSTPAVKSEQIKIRRIERDIGRLRFTMHDNREDVLETLFQWKGEQYRRTRGADKLAVPWVTRALRDVYRTQERDFRGVLSSLYAGDVLAAAHLGMRSGNILHYWFPAYDTSLKTYSPGLILLLRMLEHAPAAGVTILDFGGSTAEYKIRFANAQQTLAYGSVERWSLHSVPRAIRRGARELIIAAGLEKPARRLYAWRTLWRGALRP
jgi:CelD/BcsL family acetyltransferase involved in cellulose biosynthesis